MKTKFNNIEQLQINEMKMIFGGEGNDGHIIWGQVKKDLNVKNKNKDI